MRARHLIWPFGRCINAPPLRTRQEFECAAEVSNETSLLIQVHPLSPAEPAKGWHPRRASSGRFPDSSAEGNEIPRIRTEVGNVTFTAASRKFGHKLQPYPLKKIDAQTFKHKENFRSRKRAQAAIAHKCSGPVDGADDEEAHKAMELKRAAK